MATLALWVAAALLGGRPAEAARKVGEAPRPGMNFFSKQQDIQLGQEVAQQVRQQYEIVQNAVLQDYVKRVGERLAATPQARASEFPFNFTVINDPQVNAFALPGGPMFIFTGLMKAADTEGQLVAVMAHEMSHVILRHGTHQASKANLIQLPAMLAGAVLGDSSLLGTLTKLGAGGFILKFSRDAERDADALGSHLMAEAGYDPREMASFFGKLAQEGGRDNSSLAEFLSSHPNPGNRERAIEEEARALPRREYGFQTGQFQRAKTEVAAVPAAKPRKPAVGSTGAGGGGQPMPSQGNWQTLQAQGFTISYPGNWQVYGDRGSSMITIAPREGIAQGSSGNAQIGFGAMISYYVPENGQSNLRAATAELLHHLHAQNPGMSVVGRERRTRVAGADALATTMESRSPFGGDETDLLVTVLRPEGLFYVVCIAPEREFPKVESAFQQMIGSIRFTR